MKSLLLVLCIAVVFFAGAACAAEATDYTDYVGIYFDEEGTCNYDHVPPNVPFNAYLVFTYMSASTINAWEICLKYSNVTLLHLTERNEHITVSPRSGEYMCGLASPQPISRGTYVAADLSLMMTNYVRGDIVGSGVYFHLLPNQVPCYTDAQDVPYELHRGPFNYLMYLNDGYRTGCMPVATESETFGAVKALFR